MALVKEEFHEPNTKTATEQNQNSNNIIQNITPNLNNINKKLNEIMSPTFKNRVDTLNCFVVSKDRSILSYAGITNFTEQQSRSIVPFVYDELISSTSDQWYIRNVLRKKIIGRILTAVKNIELS